MPIVVADKLSKIAFLSKYNNNLIISEFVNEFVEVLSKHRLANSCRSTLSSQIDTACNGKQKTETQYQHVVFYRLRPFRLRTVTQHLQLIMK